MNFPDRCCRVFACFLTMAGLVACGAEQTDLLFKWRSTAGEVIEFRLADDGELRGVLLAASPKGLGRYFPTGSEALLAVSVDGGKVACRLERKLEPTNDAERREPWIVRGEGNGTINDARNGISLAFSVKRFREIHDEDGWVSEKPERDDPALALALARVELAEVRFVLPALDGFAPLPPQDSPSFSEPVYVEALFHTDQPEGVRKGKLECEGNEPREILFTRTENPKLFRSGVIYFDKKTGKPTATP